MNTHCCCICDTATIYNKKIRKIVSWGNVREKNAFKICAMPGINSTLRPKKSKVNGCTFKAQLHFLFKLNMEKNKMKDVIYVGARVFKVSFCMIIKVESCLS